MTYTVILGAYFAILALIGVLSRKSASIPILGLAAGSILAKLWTDTLTPMVAQMGLAIVSPPLSSIVAVSLTVIPAVLLFVRAPKARSLSAKLMSGVLFAACAVMLTYPAFERAVVLDDASRALANQIATNTSLVTTVCLVAAVLGVLFRKKKAPKLPEEATKGKHHK